LCIGFNKFKVICVIGIDIAGGDIDASCYSEVHLTGLLSVIASLALSFSVVPYLGGRVEGAGLRPQQGRHCKSLQMPMKRFAVNHGQTV
jgi:hypothetical protein